MTDRRYSDIIRPTTFKKDFSTNLLEDKSHKAQVYATQKGDDPSKQKKLSKGVDLNNDNVKFSSPEFGQDHGKMYLNEGVKVKKVEDFKYVTFSSKDADFFEQKGISKLIEHGYETKPNDKVLYSIETQFQAEKNRKKKEQNEDWKLKEQSSPLHKQKMKVDQQADHKHKKISSPLPPSNGKKIPIIADKEQAIKQIQQLWRRSQKQQKEKFEDKSTNEINNQQKKQTEQQKKKKSDEKKHDIQQKEGHLQMHKDKNAQIALAKIVEQQKPLDFYGVQEQKEQNQRSQFMKQQNEITGLEKQKSQSKSPIQNRTSLFGNKSPVSNQEKNTFHLVDPNNNVLSPIIHLKRKDKSPLTREKSPNFLDNNHFQEESTLCRDSKEKSPISKMIKNQREENKEQNLKKPVNNIKGECIPGIIHKNHNKQNVEMNLNNRRKSSNLPNKQEIEPQKIKEINHPHHQQQELLIKKQSSEEQQKEIIRKLIEGKKREQKEEIATPVIKWELKEKEVLMKLVEVYGNNNWDEVAKHIPRKSPSDCSYMFAKLNSL